VSDTQELTHAPLGPEPDQQPPDGRRRLVIALAALSTVIAMVAVVLTAGERDAAPAGSTAAPQTQEGVQGPVRPQGSATLEPGARSDAEAAVQNGWPLLVSDEFDGGALRPEWAPYSGETTDDVGRYVPANITVADGTLRLTGRGGSESAGLAWFPGQQYGRWEIRARSQQGNGYGGVALLWPDAEDWPVGGEINFMEIPNGDKRESHFVVHYGEDNSQVGTTTASDFTQWHNFAVEWTPDHVAGFIDGQEIFRTSDPDVIPPRPMHIAIQQDIGPMGKDWIPPLDASTPAEVTLEVDWVRIYGL
jgi:beta-glucanase (GH16 family)